MSCPDCSGHRCRLRLAVCARCWRRCVLTSSEHCRRNGKPTSLGCFDLETEAARAYDKMMLWCELHQNLGMKGGITNFDATEYEGELEYLQNITQVGLKPAPLQSKLISPRHCP